MANAFYTNLRNLVVGNGTHTLPDFDTDTLKAQLIDAGVYTYSAAHQDEADLSGDLSTTTLTSVTAGTVGVGVVDCDDIVFSTVSGAESEYIVIYQDTGTTTTSPLICIFDTTNTGLPVTPSGGDITAIVSASGLFSF